MIEMVLEQIDSLYCVKLLYEENCLSTLKWRVYYFYCVIFISWMNEGVVCMQNTVEVLSRIDGSSLCRFLISSVIVQDFLLFSNACHH